MIQAIKDAIKKGVRSAGSKFRAVMKTEAARLQGYGVAGALFIAQDIANRLGVTLSPEMVTAIQGAAVAIVIELIRASVYAEKTVEDIVADAVDNVNP